MSKTWLYQKIQFRGIYNGRSPINDRRKIAFDRTKIILFHIIRSIWSENFYLVFKEKLKLDRTKFLYDRTVSELPDQFDEKFRYKATLKYFCFPPLESSKKDACMRLFFLFSSASKRSVIHPLKTWFSINTLFRTRVFCNTNLEYSLCAEVGPSIAYNHPCDIFNANILVSCTNFDGIKIQSFIMRCSKVMRTGTGKMSFVMWPKLPCN